MTSLAYQKPARNSRAVLLAGSRPHCHANCVIDQRGRTDKRQISRRNSPAVHTRQAHGFPPGKRGADGPPGRRRWSLILASLVLFCMAGCNGSSPVSTVPESSPDQAVQTQAERGDVQVTVQVTPSRPRLSDELTLTLTISAPDHVRPDPPGFMDRFDDFTVRDFQQPVVPAQAPRSHPANHRIIQQIYTLEPIRAGSLTIPPFTVSFTDLTTPAATSGSKVDRVETEPLTVEVSTMLEAEAPSLADLRAPADPIPLPGRFPMILMWGAAAGLVILVLGWQVYRRRRAAEQQQPQLTPQQLAWQELQQLIESRLSTTDVKAFYLELTALVRRLIERTTGIRAPEQTTEEFLREIVTRKTFSTDEQVRLRSFLESADLVKFAGVRPDEDVVHDSLSKARAFIDRHSSPDDASVGRTKEPA